MTAIRRPGASDSANFVDAEVEDGWETPAAPPPPPAARDVPQPDTPVIGIRPASEPPSLEVGMAEVDIVEGDDAKPADEEDEDTKVFDRPLGYISDVKFEEARGKPATIRPPPSVSVSMADLEIQAKGREELAVRISSSVGRHDRPLSFTADVSTETIKKIASVMVGHTWFKDAASMREVILHLCRAYNPTRFTHLDEKDDEALHDEFLTMLVEDVKRPKLAQVLSQRRAGIQDEDSKRKRR